MEFRHTPVLLAEVLESLNIREDGVYADGTLGGAGHSFEIASRLTTGRLFGTDQDADAIAAASARLAPFGDRVRIFRANFAELPDILESEGVRPDGILLDLGVSSYQLDTAERGFSYMADAPLDMRMDRRRDLTVRDIVNTYPEEELSRILWDYGEERFSRNIAKHIVKNREKAPIETTFELVDTVKAAIPARARAGEGHPAKRTFQALRIACNDELGVLEGSIDRMIDVLAPGGRLCIITFHSLEDRIVKNRFRTAEHPCICPPDFPVCTCGRVPKGTVITRKPILPGEKEREDNPRSKSAKLRVFEKKR